MSNVFDTYLGSVDEVTYGTAVAVTKFYEPNSVSVTGVYENIESPGLRSGARVLRADRQVRNPKGAAGEIELDVLSKGFGHVLKHMFGSSSTGATADGVTPHTFTMGTLNGKSFTLQIGKVDSAGTLTPYTYAGCKIPEWSVSCDVDGLLVATINVDAASEANSGSGAFATQSASYPSLAKVMSFIGAQVTLDASPFLVSSASVSATNGLKLDRYSIGSSTKRQPLESEMREYSVELVAEYEAKANYDLVKNGTVGALVLSWAAAAEGADDPATLVITLPAVRFDAGEVTINGREILTQTLSGKVLDNGTDPAITVVYTSPDATI